MTFDESQLPDMNDIVLPELSDVEMELMTRGMRHFISTEWKYVDPAKYIHNWHIDFIAEHLEAVLDGQIKRLIINVPPRHMKSLIVSVFFPSYAWLKDPSLSFLFSSYSHSLSIRDSVKCRRIIQSPPYQKVIEDKHEGFRLTGDQNTKIRFENNMGGYRLATSVDGALTGDGGDIIVIDDPHNVVEGESEAVRNSTLSWWDEAMSTRLNNPKTGSYIIIMQRVNEEDLTGHILASNHDEYDHICLPARYEGHNRVVSTLNKKDPRKVDGDLLWPERQGEKELNSLEKSLGVYGTAGQLQQRPAPREGGMFKPHEMPVMLIAPGRVIRKVRYWDKAGTKDGGAYTAGVLLGEMDNGMDIVMDVVRGQWEALEREQIIKQTAQMDGTAVQIGLEQEGGSGGKESAEATVRNLKGYRVITDHPTGDKAFRAEPFAVQVNAGNVCMLKGDWNKEYVKELENFPVGKYKDQADASSGGYNLMHNTKKRAGTWGSKNINK